MPVRPRRVRRARFALSPRLDLAVTIGPTPGRDDDLLDDLLREVWREHRAWFLARCEPRSRPWAWWRFEPAVPDVLRATRPMLYAPGEAESRRRDEADVTASRRAWLAEHEACSP